MDDRVGGWEKKWAALGGGAKTMLVRGGREMCDGKVDVHRFWEKRERGKIQGKLIIKELSNYDV